MLGFNPLASAPLGEDGAPSIYSFSVLGIATGSPLVDTLVATQTHSLSLPSLSSGSPTVDSTALSETYSFVVEAVTTGVPEVGYTALADVYSLGIGGITTGPVYVGVAGIQGESSFTLTGIVSGAPTIGDLITYVKVFGEDNYNRERLAYVKPLQSRVLLVIPEPLRKSHTTTTELRMALIKTGS